MLNNFLVTIVLYKQALFETNTFKTLSSSLYSNDRVLLLVYDNSPQPQIVPSIHGNWQIIYIHDGKNEGISKAYNQSALIAARENKNWLLFADQDTNFGSGIFSELNKVIAENKDVQIFAPILKKGNQVISPCWQVWEKAFHMPTPKVGIQRLKNKSVINSGLCVSLSAFKNAGGYNSKIKLDFSDHYFIKNIKKHYDYIYFLKTPVEHSLSFYTDNLESAIVRFKYYCEGARHYSTLKNVTPVFLICTFRMIKLTLQSKTLSFFLSYTKYFISKGKI